MLRVIFERKCNEKNYFRISIFLVIRSYTSESIPIKLNWLNKSDSFQDVSKAYQEKSNFLKNISRGHSFVFRSSPNKISNQQNYCQKNRISLESHEVSVLRDMPKNEALHSLHLAFVQIVNEADFIVKNGKNLKLKKAAEETAHIAVYGCSLNKEGELLVARSIAYVCRASITVLKAVFKGIEQGLKGGVRSILHPLESASAFIKTVVNCGMILGGLLLENDVEMALYLSKSEINQISHVKEKEFNRLLKACTIVADQISKMTISECIESTQLYWLNRLF